MKKLLSMRDELPSVIKFDQEYMNKLNKGMLEEAKTENEKKFYESKLNGGNCIYCGQSWKREKKETELSNYIHYVPDCECYQKMKEKKKKDEMKTKLYQFVGMPKKYVKKELEKMDMKNITLETKTAIEKVESYLESKVYNNGIGCLLYGDIGTGKTLLACMILKYLLIEANKDVRYIRMSDIIGDIIKSNFEFSEKLLVYDAVLFDDIDKLKSCKNKGWVSERIFSMFDGMINNSKIIIATTNCQKLTELNNMFDSSVISRIVGNCEVINVKGNDYRLVERAMIREKAGL